MGTRYSASFFGPNTPALAQGLAATLAEVDAQMSTWRADSDLMRLNTARPGTWVDLPEDLISILRRALRIGAESGGLFDISLGDITTAWGFGPARGTSDPARIAANLGHPHPPAHQTLELDPTNRRARRHSAALLDLSGIAKGHATDRMIACLKDHGIRQALAALDGELSALGTKEDGTPWAVAVERPDHDQRAPLSMITLSDCSVATSGDYRHWVRVGNTRLAHTMDPRLGGPNSKPSRFGHRPAPALCRG